MPQGIEPMLAVLAQQLPADDSAFGYEFKWDGVRALCSWEGRAKIRLESRNLLDITRRYPELWDLGKALGRQAVILDGEIVAMDDAGMPSFARLQQRMHVDRPLETNLIKEVPVFYVIFDVLYANRRSTLELPYHARRQLLEQLALDGASWRITPAREGGGKEMLDTARRTGLEGIVAKKLDSVYEPGRRSPSWLKFKVISAQEFVIGGWIPEAGAGSGSSARVGSLLVGYYDCPRRGQPARLHFAGGVGTGFTHATHEMLMRRLASLESRDSPFAERIPKRTARFVRPKLVAEIEFRRWPVDGSIQQAAFKGLRDDKQPQKVVREDRPNCPT